MALSKTGRFLTQRALRDRLMSRSKNCLRAVSRQFLTRNYPRPNCLLKCLPNCLSPTREGFLSSFKISPAVRVIARQVRDKNCLAAIFAPRHQSVSSGPLGSKAEILGVGVFSPPPRFMILLKSMLPVAQLACACAA